MIKKFLIAATLVIASPALVFSQNLFLSFDSTMNTTTALGVSGTSGTATIFVDQPFAFDALDLDITSSDSSVLLLTGGTGFNGEYIGNPFLSGVSFNSNNVTLDGATGVANLFAANITENGIIPAGASFNEEFVAGAGSGMGAIKLGEVTFDLVGNGVSTLELSLGTQGALSLPMTLLDPTFGSAAMTVGIPEPSSASLLVLGAVGMVARRRRARA